MISICEGVKPGKYLQIPGWEGIMLLRGVREWETPSV